MKARHAGARIGWLLAVTVVTLHAQTLRVATYNLENYGPASRMTEAGFRLNYPKPEAQKMALRQVIRGLDADVLILQEMGSQLYLDELCRDLAADGMRYARAALVEGEDEARHLALLSRGPLLDLRVHRDLEFAYLGGRARVKRGVVEATVSSEGGPLTVFGVHLKSRLTERPDDPASSVRRAAEATAIRDRIRERLRSGEVTQFLVVGDCNDGRSSRTLSHLQKRGRTEIVRLLPASDSRGEVWTHLFRREESYSRVDHVFVSPDLVPQVVGRQARIFDGEGVLQASDHRPVFVDVVVGDKKSGGPIGPPR
jgi:endonuclease/exonuclease/phosphatase family metal-dependent hydrolase